MTQYLESLDIGDYIDVRGPNGLLLYKDQGTTFLTVNGKHSISK